MSILPATIRKEQLWYLEFAENQLLQALSHICDQGHDPKLKAKLLLHRNEVSKLVQRRKKFFQGLHGQNGVAHKE